MWIITTTVCLALLPLSCGVSDLLCSCGFTYDVQHAAGVWRGPRLWLNNNHRCVRKPENAGWTAGVTQHLECRRGCVFFCRHYKGRRGLLKAHMYAVSIFFYCCSACKISRIDEPILAEHRLRDANRGRKAGEGNDRLQVLKVERASSQTDLSRSLALICRFILLTTPAVVSPQTPPLQWALPLLWRLRRALAQQEQWWRPVASQEEQVEHPSASLTPHTFSPHRSVTQLKIYECVDHITQYL